MFAYGEQAGANLAVGRHPDAAAVSAKRLRNGGDYADLADTIFKAVAAGGFTAPVFNFLQRHELGHATHDLVQGDYNFRRPDAVFFQRHELDKSNDNTFLASEAAEGGDLVIVKTAQQDAVHFHRIQSGSLGDANSCQHPL